MSGYCNDCGNTQCLCKEIEQQEKPTSSEIKIDVGEPARTFAMGEYLNAIDEITCHFVDQRASFDVAGALRMYADHVDAESLRVGP